MSSQYATPRRALPLLGPLALLLAAGGAPAASAPEIDARATFEFSSGKTYVAALPAERSKDLWLSGPQVTEYRQVVTPVESSSKAKHPSLRVIYDVRQYHDGKARLDVTVENVLDVAAATKYTYDFTLTAGDQKFQKKGLTHPWMTRYRVVLGLGGLVVSRNTPNFESVYQAQALPRYMTNIQKLVLPAAGEKFDVLGPGGLSTDMGMVGGRRELAPYPDWTASFLVYRLAPQEKYVLRSGDLAASWPVHVRNRDGSLVSLDRRPKYWLDGRWSPWNDGPAAANKMQDAKARGSLQPDNAHVPSLAYVPYLLTGDRFYADEMKFWANYGLLATYPGDAKTDRQGARAILKQNQTRGIAWVVRNMADAAAYLPDADPFKKYLRDKLTNNLKWLDEQAAHPGPLGVAWHSVDSPERPDKPQYVVSLWAHNYLAWAIDHANRHGIAGGTKWCDMIVRFQLSLFTDPDYPRELVAPYRLAIGVKDGDKSVRYLKRPEVARQTLAFLGSPTPIPGYYGVDARLMLLIARAKGMPGAKKAYDRLEPLIAQDLRNRCGWDLAPYPDEKAKSSARPLPAKRAFTKGWATFPLVLPQGAVPKTATIKVGTLQTQNDVKCRWPDGSLKLVVLTALVPRAGEYSIHAP